ncbi:MAG: DUF2085 domain-containing protein [Acidobacteria bacterium]|nr:DUF2085 domain-containing protein [Acidobacteriota bacterium]
MLTGERKRARAVYISLLLVSLAWLGLIFAAPYLSAERHPVASLLLYQGFSAICHQMPDRSFHFHGFPLGVCSRCTGIYGGFLAGLIFYPLLRTVESEISPTRWWLIASTAPILIDSVGGSAGLFANTFHSRSITGAVCGFVAAFYILPGFVSIISSRAVKVCA